MTDTNPRFTGIFHGITFAVKEKDKNLVQTADLSFRVELGESGLDQVTPLIPWQKQQVFLQVARRQGDLFDGKPSPQGKLPLAEPETTSPPPAASPGVGDAKAAYGESKKVWAEVDATGEDGNTRTIFLRSDGKGFICWDCSEEFEIEEGENLYEMVRKHACKDDDRVCRVCGCTDDQGCPDPGCSWVEIDLCSNPDCLAKAGYSEEEIEKIQGGSLPAVILKMERSADVELRCADGVTRKFGYGIDDGFISNVYCESCDEQMINWNNKDRRPEDELYGLMRNHACPSMCHKCRAKERFGVALADLIIYHRPDCPGRDSFPPEIDGLMHQLSQMSYADRVREAYALDLAKNKSNYNNAAKNLVLEDCQEAIARFEDAAGLSPSMARPTEYARRLNYDSFSKSRLAGIKKAVKDVDKKLGRKLEALLKEVAAAKKADNECPKYEPPPNEKTANCRICGCTEENPCSKEAAPPDGCFTVDDDLCSNPKCLEAAGYTPEQVAVIQNGGTVETPGAPSGDPEGAP